MVVIEEAHFLARKNTLQLIVITNNNNIIKIKKYKTEEEEDEPRVKEVDGPDRLPQIFVRGTN